MAPQVQQKTAEETDDAEFATTLDEHLRAGYQIMYVPTSEEARVETEISRVAKNLKSDVITWDCFEGFSCEHLKKEAKYKNPVFALEALVDETIFPVGKAGEGGNHVFVFRDLDDYMTDSQIRRRLRSLAEGNRLVNRKYKRPLIILSPSMNIHTKLRASITIIDFALPGETKLKRQIEFVRQSIESKDPSRAVVSDELRELLATNLLGLTSNEAENCLSRCIVRHSGFKPEMLKTIKDEKAAIVKKSEVLTYIPEDTTRTRADIGGYDLFMDWMEMRKLAYTPSARAENIDYPKGVVLMGVPGSGKSVVAKAACLIMGLPGYILDIGSLFGSMVGESEQRTRDALRQVDAQKGCVLVIDEADKALGNAHNSSGDSGVTKRVFGTILSWLADNNSRTFVIVTLNRTEGLPPEFLRAGRFDAMFYTDLPTELERRQILEIHMRRRGVDPKTLGMAEPEWDSLIEGTKGFVGSELEEVVRESRYQSFASHKTGIPTFEQFIEAAAAIVPMTVRDPQGIESIRTFCQGRAKPVTSPSRAKPAIRNQRAVNLDK